MKPRTQQHLRRAERNVQLARRLAAEESPSEWVLVIAFYAAVQYVAAYLREFAGIAPESRHERERFILASAALAPLTEAYRRLFAGGHIVRYSHILRLGPNAIPNVLGDLAQIRTVVLAALDAP